MSYIREAVPAAPRPKSTDRAPRNYVVLSTNCVWGKQGERVSLTLSDGEELCLFQAGVLEKAEPVRPPAVAAEKKGK